MFNTPPSCVSLYFLLISKAQHVGLPTSYMGGKAEANFETQEHFL